MLTSMLLIAGCWIVLVGLLIGLGTATWKLSGASTPVQGTSAFFIGWAVWIGILQLLNFWLPLGHVSVIALLIGLGVLGWAWNGRTLGAKFRASLRERRFVFLGFALFALWLANRSLGPLLAIDAGLYHLTAIKWASDYPLITGLGNLHGRLAFNSAGFLWLSSLDAGPGLLRSYNVALGPLLLVAIARIGARAFVHRPKARDLEAAQMFHAISLLPLLYAAAVMHVSSTSPDWIILILGVVLASEWVERSDLGSNPDEKGNFLAIAALCASGIAVKLSFAVLGGAVLALGIVGVLRLHPGNRYSALRALLPGIMLVLLLLVPWSLRSLGMSGYPAYPSTLFAIDVSWRVPQSHVENEVRWIRSWARSPGASPERVLGNRDWILPWLKNRLRSSDSVALLLFPLAFSGWGLFGYGVRRGGMPRWVPWLLGSYATSVLCWFVIAPDPRFLGSALWICAATLLASAPRQELAGKEPDAMRRISLAGTALGILGYLAFVIFMGSKVGGAYIRPGPMDGRYPLQNIQTKKFRTRSGLVLNIPRSGDRCWEAPLPCTPFGVKRLRLRIEDQLAAGFELEPPETTDREAATGKPSG